MCQYRPVVIFLDYLLVLHLWIKAATLAPNTTGGSPMATLSRPSFNKANGQLILNQSSSTIDLFSEPSGATAQVVDVLLRRLVDRRMLQVRRMSGWVEY